MLLICTIIERKTIPNFNKFIVINKCERTNLKAVAEITLIEDKLKLKVFSCSKSNEHLQD